VLLLLIIVCACSWLPLMAIPIATITSFFIRVMNTQVLRLSNISFGLIDHIAFNGRSLVYSYLLIAGLSCWILYKTPFCLLISLGILLIWLLGFP
jgi:hypothetical protein